METELIWREVEQAFNKYLSLSVSSTVTIDSCFFFIPNGFWTDLPFHSDKKKTGNTILPLSLFSSFIDAIILFVYRLYRSLNRVRVQRATRRYIADLFPFLSLIFAFLSLSFHLNDVVGRIRMTIHVSRKRSDEASLIPSSFIDRTSNWEFMIRTTR